MTNVKISDHPILQLPRIAFSLFTAESEERQDVQQVVEIRTYKGENVVEKKTVPLLASNETKVNPITGNIVLADEESGMYPAESIGQYDYLKSGLATVGYYELKIIHIKKADEAGRFN